MSGYTGCLRVGVGVRGWGSRSGTTARGRDGRDSRPVRSRTDRRRGGRPGRGCRARRPSGRGRCRPASSPVSTASCDGAGRSRRASAVRAGRRDRAARPGRSSYSLAALSSRQPPSDWRAQSNQASTMARSRGSPRGSFSAGRRDEDDEALAGGIEHRQLQVLARAEMGEDAALGHAHRLRQRADRQAFQSGRAGDAVGAVDDGLAGGGAFAGGGHDGHGWKIARPFVLFLTVRRSAAASGGSVAGSSRRLGAGARGASCICTVSSQRPCLRPRPGKHADRAEAQPLVQGDRSGVADVADDGDHLPEARALCSRRSAVAAARGRRRGPAVGRRCRPCPRRSSDSPRGCGSCWRRHSRRSAVEFGDEVRDSPARRWPASAASSRLRRARRTRRSRRGRRLRARTAR